MSLFIVDLPHSNAQIGTLALVMSVGKSETIDPMKEHKEKLRKEYMDPAEETKERMRKEYKDYAANMKVMLERHPEIMRKVRDVKEKYPDLLDTLKEKLPLLQKHMKAKQGMPVSGKEEEMTAHAKDEL